MPGDRPTRQPDSPSPHVDPDYRASLDEIDPTDLTPYQRGYVDGFDASANRAARSEVQPDLRGALERAYYDPDGHEWVTADGEIDLGNIWRDIRAALATPAPALDDATDRWLRGPLLPADPKYIQFTAHAAHVMVERLGHGRAKFGVDWYEQIYTDEDNLERLRRAVDHLEAARRNSPDPDEWAKRAADVANQAFMFADPARLATDPSEPRDG